MAEVTLLLADSAQDADGRIHALGIGLSETVTPTPQMALIILLSVPWDQAGRTMTLDVELLDQDGQAVAPGQDDHGNPVPIRVTANVETERDTDALPGSPLESGSAIRFDSGIPLDPGQYQWRVSIDGDPVAVRPFRVRSAAD